MVPSAAQLRSIYRSLLRELPPRPILRSPRAPLHTRLRETISTSSATTSSAATSEAEAARGVQLAHYLRSQRKYVTLLERYNPGMGMDEEERIRLTARRVGMDLPLEYGLGRNKA
ncbi:uncharacterized protein J7T54_004769 [Emericellopsis cladophorae]|uniref:Uncharacterized protein n=1 Tax=Emericellopsis cladophorae TaxID=2686198 RepID=A0A9P9Y6Z5_9HYPO|nr:uncharacterized protein J7T54_004769 [Emericellopsis cladophorae]KAI6784223.1 hypothetical protein J7T54_004769 [Emericellopsis cladophorae]